jgi:FSR family fosmidomycin resistance protein-like MFS transporter
MIVIGTLLNKLIGLIIMPVIQTSGKEIVKALFIVWIAHFLVDMMIGFWSVYKTLANLDIAVMGLIAGVCPFIGEGMQIFFGSLGDKGYRKILLAFGLGIATFNALIPFTFNYSILFGFYLLTCIGSGAFHPSAVAITSSLTQNRKGLFVTIFASGGAFGLALSHLIFSTFYDYGKTTIAYLMIPSLMLMLYVLLTKVPGTFSMPALPGKNYGFQDLKKLFQCRELLTLYFFQICNQSIVWGLIFLLPDILQSKGYDPWISFGAGHFCLIVGGACMMVPGGYLSDKYSAKVVLLFSNLFGMVLFYIFLFISLLPATGVLSLLFALGAALNIATPVAVAFGNKLMPSRPGLVSAFLMGMVWCVSEGIGPGGGGLLTKVFVEDAPTKAMAIIGIFFIFGKMFIYLLPREVEKPVEAVY